MEITKEILEELGFRETPEHKFSSNQTNYRLEVSGMDGYLLLQTHNDKVESSIEVIGNGIQTTLDVNRFNAHTVNGIVSYINKVYYYLGQQQKMKYFKEIMNSYQD